MAYEAGHVLRYFMKENKITYKELALALHYNNPATARDRLTRYNTIKVETLARMVKAMGLELIIRDPATKREWEIEK